MEQASLLHHKTVCIITGASRGIGKEIAVRLSSNVAPHSKCLLLARNEQDLLETAAEIRKNSAITADTFICDLSKLAHDGTKDFEMKLESILDVGSQFEVAMIIHNAGTVGDVSQVAAKFDNPQEIHAYLDMNLISFIMINNAFLRALGSGNEKAKQRVVVNITSLLAIKSLPGFGMYAMGKAAREAFTRSLAAEDNNLRVINYSPGPVKTDMTSYIKDTVWDGETKAWFKNAFDSGTILTTEQTVTKFLRLLDQNTVENAVHCDYFDFT